MFFRTVDMGTDRYLSAQKLDASMATKTQLTGYQTRTTAQLKGSRRMRPSAANARTRATQSAHWKKRRASGARKSKEESAALLRSVWRRGGGRRWRGGGRVSERRAARLRG
jgi:hypothetical protein